MKHFEVLAFTTVAGNSDLDSLTVNIARCLELAKKEVPIFAGAATPLLRPLETAPMFHGTDGFGDFYPKEWKGAEKCIQKDKTAAEAIIEIVNANPG